MTRRGVAWAAPCVALYCLAMPAAAQNSPRALSIQPSVALTNTVTDNRDLSSTGKEADNILEVSPSLRVVSRSGAVQGTLDYTMTGVIYARGSDLNEIRHTLSAAFVAQPVPERVTVDARASIARQSISAFGTPNNGSGLRNDNTTDVATLSVSPTFRGRLGSAAEYEAALNYSTSRASEAESANNTLASGRLRVSGNLGRIGVALNATRDVSEFDEGRRTTEGRLVLSASSRFFNDVTLTGRAGTERNDVETEDGASNATYGIGVNWTPTERTLLGFDADRRYFGNSHSLIFQHRMSRATFRYVDSRGATSDTSFLGLSNYDLLFTQFASVEPNPVLRDLRVREYLRLNGLDASGRSGLGFLTRAVSLQRRQELSMVLLGVRSSATLSAFRTETSRLDGLANVDDDLTLAGVLRQTGFNLTLSHRLTPLSSLVFAASQYQTEADGPVPGNDQRTYSLSLAGQLALRTGYSLTVRRSDAGGPNAYTESAVIGTLNWQF